MPRRPLIRNFTGKGDDTAAEIYHAVGVASSTWEVFELALMELFLLLTGSNRDAGGRAYGTIASFRGRADAIVAAAEAHHYKRRNPGGLRRLKKFMNEASNLATSRNEIVHGIVNDLFARQWTRHVGFAVMPAHYMSRKRYVSGHAKYVYRRQHIEKFADDVQASMTNAIAICRRLQPRTKSR
jgi:hypothetical protein